MTSPGDREDRRVEASAFYWAMLSTPGRSVRGEAARRRVLDNLLDTELPVPVERVQAAYAELGSGRVLACAIEREKLAELVSDDPRSLTPAALPPWLSAEEVLGAANGARLNLLCGAFEPRFRVRARQRRVARVAALALVALLAIITGMELRTAAATTSVRDAEVRVAALADELTPRAASLPPSMRLAAKTRRVSVAAHEAMESPHPGSAWPMLRVVLAAWPEGSGTWLDSARADNASIAMSVGGSDAEALGVVIRQIVEGVSMRADQPTITAGAGGARAMVSLTPASGGVGEGP